MFSEYASRFLQQSTAGRLSFTANDPDSRRASQNPLDRRRLVPGAHRSVQRPTAMMPHHRNPSASQSRFPFANRLTGRTQQESAPLFYSATGDLEDDDEEDEHEREVADFYALQRSRQHFGRSHLTESSELEDNSIERAGRVGHDAKGDDAHYHTKDIERLHIASNAEMPRRDSSRSRSDSGSTWGPSTKAKGQLVDVNLASTIAEEDPPASLANLSPLIEPDDDSPPPFQTFRPSHKPELPLQHSTFFPSGAAEEAGLMRPRPPSPSESVLPAPTVILPSPEPPKHDAVWANLYQISLFAMVAAFILVWFNTSAPSSKKPLGDTIYSALRGSTTLLLWDTLIAVVVALAWLALLRQHVRPLIYILIAAVPIILFSFSLYSFIGSFKGSHSGSSLQDKVMRWCSWIPLAVAVIWTLSVVRARHNLHRSISILQFSTKILTASPFLVVLGFATLATTVTFTWIWMLMFERVFLGGRFSSKGAGRFLVDANSWWLGAFFVLQYLWSLGVIAGVQRATTAATVSQWYFHRLAVPQPSSKEVITASLYHSTGALLGTVCLSSFLSLLVRLPLIILPGRISSAITMCAYWVIPTSIVTLTNPLTLTYAAIHSQPLGISARGLGQLSFISNTNPSNTLGPAHYQGHARSGDPSIVSYRLAKLLLQATKYIMSLALGFSGWVRTARTLELAGVGGGIRGSLYAYIVGFIAGTIGFTVLGTIENIVGAVLDAILICWASETGGRGEARFCREAGDLFGDD
ncbi:hypothetical protein K431DRAFT_243819 [Polychaeton citri CBS 116435]|uniref:Protein PNS1 n=1 Tax=Polychaeton citri CBS 116435 TaxID=1314669 RepID=A0A9P4QC32_9PEZI|nr:hypothetical protein K431DRAFT_243819 [Polychaeton citri CBS 116435]